MPSSAPVSVFFVQFLLLLAFCSSLFSSVESWVEKKKNKFRVRSIETNPGSNDFIAVSVAF